MDEEKLFSDQPEHFSMRRKVLRPLFGAVVCTIICAVFLIMFVLLFDTFYPQAGMMMRGPILLVIIGAPVIITAVFWIRFLVIFISALIRKLSDR